MIVGSHVHQRSHTKIDRSGVDQRNPAGDHTGCFEVLHSPPARRGGEPNVLGELTCGQAGVLLKQLQYFPINFVHNRTLLQISRLMSDSVPQIALWLAI